jgi:hypothetical protein
LISVAVQVNLEEPGGEAERPQMQLRESSFQTSVVLLEITTGDLNTRAQTELENQAAASESHGLRNGSSFSVGIENTLAENEAQEEYGSVANTDSLDWQPPRIFKTVRDKNCATSIELGTSGVI